LALALSSSPLPAGRPPAPAILSAPPHRSAPASPTQGFIEQDGTPFTGACDFRFGLFDAATGPAQVGVADVSNTNKPVTNGLFAVVINASNQFTAAAFGGSNRWLEVEARCPAGAGLFTPFAARQQITPAPYALFSQSSLDSSQLGGFPANQYGRYTRTIIVNPVEGDDTASGTRLAAALAGITDASTNKRYLVHVEPGQYRVSVTLLMKPFVDFEGAGPSRTIIQATSGSIIQGAANSEIRGVTVSVLATGIVAINAAGGLDASVRNVAITGSFQTGISAIGSLLVEDLTLDITCNASPCTGILSAGGASPFTARRTVLNMSASFGIVRTMTVTNTSYGVYDSEVVLIGSAGGTANLAALESQGSGNVLRSRFLVFGAGSQGAGLVLGADTRVTNSIISAAVSSVGNFAIDATSDVSIRESDISAGGANGSVGVNFHPAFASIAQVQSSRVSDQLPTVGIGIRKQTPIGTMLIFNTDINTGGATVVGAADAGGIRVTASQLRGAAAAGGVICAGVTDENTLFTSGPACP
jgi:hypothetical protein